MEPQKALEKMNAQVIEGNLRELAGESDRACGVLVAALIDDALSQLLKAFLVATSSGSRDSLLGDRGSLSDFWVKANLAYRLGLISSKLRADLQVIAEIRNKFAHAGHECTFQTEYVKTRVSKLGNSFGDEANRAYEEASAQSAYPYRNRFTWCALHILGALTVCGKATSRQTEAAEEIVYA